MQAGQFHPVLVDYLTQVADLAQAVVELAKNAAPEDALEQNVLYCANNAHAHLLNARSKLKGADEVFAVK